MISDNIKKYRREKGITQEALAESLHVVRQTISKWEKGLSAPDADLLPKIADTLGISIHQLLGIEEPAEQELASAQEALAYYRQRTQLAELASRKRNLILFLSFLSMITMLIVENELVSMILIGAAALSAMAVLYHNLEMLTSEADDAGMKALKRTAVFDICLMAAAVFAAVLFEMDIVQNEAFVAMLVVACVILFGGYISPKLPFNRHTGLRLPWTVLDKAAWNAAHRTLGMISLPIVLLYVAAVCTIPCFETVTMVTIAAWIAIPAFLSFLVFWHSRSKK